MADGQFCSGCGKKIEQGISSDEAKVIPQKNTEMAQTPNGNLCNEGFVSSYGKYFYIVKDSFGIMQDDGKNKWLIPVPYCTNLCCDENSLWFLSGSGSKKQLYSLSHADRVVRKVNNCLIDQFCITNDNIFYIDGGNLNFNMLPKRGGVPTQLCKMFFSYCLCVDEWLFLSAGTKGIYKMKADGSSLTQIYTGKIRTWQLCVVGQSVYFNGSSDKGLYRIQSDGSNFEQLPIEMEHTRWFNVQKHKIWFADKDYTLTVYDMENQSLKQIMIPEPEGVSLINISNDIVYFSKRSIVGVGIDGAVSTNDNGEYQLQIVEQDSSDSDGNISRFFFIHRKENLKHLGAVTEAVATNKTVSIFEQPYGYLGNLKAPIINSFDKASVANMSMKLHYDAASYFAFFVCGIGGLLTIATGVGFALFLLGAVVAIFMKHTKLIIILNQGQRVIVIAKSKKDIKLLSNAIRA